MRHSKRSRLTVDDINAALRVRNVEPLYGFTSGDQLRFKKTIANMNDIYYVGDDEVDFDTILTKPLPRVPLDVTFTAHWLAIEGVQPAIPQNPTPIGMYELYMYLWSHYTFLMFLQKTQNPTC